jgi:hypothetical protein
MTLMAALLLLPALAASGDIPTADGTQEVELNVRAANEVGIWVEGSIGLGTIVPGQTVQREFQMGATNTYNTGTWTVSVSGPAFQDFTFGDCYEWGCERVDTPEDITIPASALTVYGENQENWDPGVIDGSSGTLDTNPVILTGTADAYGEFGIDSPNPWMELAVPGTADYAMYYTTLTYTITHSD